MKSFSSFYHILFWPSSILNKKIIDDPRSKLKVFTRSKQDVTIIFALLQNQRKKKLFLFPTRVSSQLICSLGKRLCPPEQMACPAPGLLWSSQETHMLSYITLEISEMRNFWLLILATDPGNEKFTPHSHKLQKKKPNVEAKNVIVSILSLG